MLWWEIPLAESPNLSVLTSALHYISVGESLILYCEGKWRISAGGGLDQIQYCWVYQNTRHNDKRHISVYIPTCTRITGATAFRLVAGETPRCSCSLCGPRAMSFRRAHNTLFG